MQAGFVSWNLFGLLALVGGTSGSPTHDLVSLIRAEDYFKSRNIAVKPEEMVRLALKEPADGKAQVQQLLAIRWLGKNAAAAKKAAGARAALEEIAAGKKAQDPQGFARLYARQALARLDGKDLPVAAAPAGSAREGCAWFPADSNLVVSAEFRPSSPTVSGAADLLRDALFTMLPPRARREMYEFGDRIGNLRIDRVSVGQTLDENGDLTRLAVRITGAGDRKRLIGLLSQAIQKATIKESKGQRGESVTLIGGSGRFDSTFALVGDSDLLIVAPAPVTRHDAGKTLQQMLAVRAGKEKSTLAGVLAAVLKEAPANARSLVAYDLPEKVRAKVLKEFKPLPALPAHFLAHLSPKGTGDATKQGRMMLHARGTMKDEAEVKVFVEAARQLKEKGLKSLDNLPPRAMVPPDLVKSLRQTLAALSVEAAGATVKAEMPYPSEKVLLKTLELYLVPRGPAPPVEAPRPPRP